MLIYITATGLMLVLCLWLYPKAGSQKVRSVVNIKDGRKLVFSCIMVMLPLFFVMGCRWNVGVDTWHTYTPDYLAMKSESIPLTDEEEEILRTSVQIKFRLYGYSREQIKDYPLEEAYKEHRITYHHTAPGFQLLERILVFFHADVQWLYIISSLLIVGFVFASIWIQYSRPLLPCLFFVITANFFLAMNIVSQYIAIAVCIFACTFAQNRKPVWFFVLVGIAATFHVSALAFLPAYFLPKLKIKPIWCAITVIVCLLIDRFAFPFIIGLVENIPKYSHYFSRDGAEFEWILFAIGCAVFAISTYYYPKGQELPYFRLWYYLNVLGLIVLAFSGHIPLIKRINYYFAAPHFLLIPMVLNLEKRPSWRRTLYIVTIGLFCAMIGVSIGRMNKHGVLPYQFFFQGDRVQMMIPYVDHLQGLW